jgi:hypothetical protein
MAHPTHRKVKFVNGQLRGTVPAGSITPIVCYGFFLSERELGKNMIEIEGKMMNKGSWRGLSLLQTMGSSRGPSSPGLTRLNILSFHIFLLHSMRFYRRVPSATSFPSRTFLPTDYC